MFGEQSEPSVGMWTETFCWRASQVSILLYGRCSARFVAQHRRSIALRYLWILRWAGLDRLPIWDGAERYRSSVVVFCFVVFFASPSHSDFAEQTLGLGLGEGLWMPSSDLSSYPYIIPAQGIVSNWIDRSARSIDGADRSIAHNMIYARRYHMVWVHGRTPLKGNSRQDEEIDCRFDAKVAWIPHVIGMVNCCQGKEAWF